MRAWTTRVARASGGVRDGGWRGDDENMDRDVGARGVVFVRARWRGGAMERVDGAMGARDRGLRGVVGGVE